MTVYFIQAAEDGPIKIGFTNGDANVRLKELQIGNHKTLHLLATTDGGPKIEREIHSLFNECKIRGEWFWPSINLLSYIAVLDVEFLEIKQGGEIFVKDLIAKIGREKIIEHIGVSTKSVSAAIAANKFPASWYLPMHTLGVDNSVVVDASLFNWKRGEVSA